MNKARITLSRDVKLGSYELEAQGPGFTFEVSYEDCLGTMLPKFYYPADPTELEIRSPYGRPAGTKREPSYQVPADAIEKAECDDPEVIARWERLYEERCERELLQALEDDRDAEYEETLEARRLANDSEEIGPTVVCANCEGVVIHVARSGRTAKYRGETYDVPADIAIPTCVSCGAEWESGELSAQLDAIFEEVRLERAIEEFHGPNPHTNGSAEERPSSWLIRWIGEDEGQGQFLLEEDRSYGLLGIKWTLDVDKARRWPHRAAAEAYIERVGWDVTAVEVCATYVSAREVGETAKVNGTSATLDATSCFTDAELAAIYARGSR